MWVYEKRLQFPVDIKKRDGEASSFEHYNWTSEPWPWQNK